MLAPGFEYYGQGYQIGMYFKIENRVYLEGLIKKSSGTIALHGILFSLPMDYRPNVGSDIYGKQLGEVLHNIKVLQNGDVVVHSNPIANIKWLAIDGL